MNFEEGFEFCSTVFKKIGRTFSSHPLNLEKQLWNLLCNQSANTTPLQEYNEFELRFRNHPLQNTIFNVLTDCGFISSLYVKEEGSEELAEWQAGVDDRE